MAGPTLLLNLILQFSAIAISFAHSKTDTRPFPAIFTFGDGFGDTGNNNFLDTLIKANHAPYGLSFPGRTATGRFSDGRLFPEFIAAALKIKDLIPPFADPSISGKEIRTGVSFASAGAGYDEVTTLFDGVLPLSKQVENFGIYVRRLNDVVGEVKARNILESSIAVVVAGTSDLILNVYQTPARQIKYGLAGYQDFLHQNIQITIRNLYNQGLRKFLIAGLPPIGCLPLQRTTKLSVNHCVEDENLDSQIYNQKLIAFLPKVQGTLPASKIVYADIYTPLDQIVAKPAQYGLAVTDRGCCGTGLVEAAFLCKQFSPACENPTQFLFWDAAHPSEAAHKVVAQYLLEHTIPQLLPGH